MHYYTNFFVGVILVMLLLVDQQALCDAAATKAPEKMVVIKEPSAPAAEAEAVKLEERTSVKKALDADTAPAQKDTMVVVNKGSPAEEPDDVKSSAPESDGLPVEDVHVEHSRMPDDIDFPGQVVVFILVGITSSAILVLVLRVYRLRLSRAERKYGVQGDRANQELTPLPMAIEDVNSDEEDHTLFEVNRQNIRIL
ncbi:hypothetical protein KR009_002379 [Drosophila setifemur]|nr:hypothetical protein KR009_002379 [Drosophila setifemur]